VSWRLRRIWLRIRRRGRTILSVLAIYISVTGLVTFSLFILEESIQTAMFGTWPAQDAKDWELVRFGCERMRDANNMMRTINYSLGWIQPLAFLAYRAFSESTESYIQSLEARIFANAPEIFSGKTMTFAFMPQTIAETPDGLYAHINHRIRFLSPVRLPTGRAQRVTGTISNQGDQVVIREAR
jgi:hypothetical protein